MRKNIGAITWCVLGLVVLGRAADGNWYERSFYLLHEDHHTRGEWEVGRDADPAQTARLINLSTPDVIQIHAKGNPGWTTYPSKVGHTPPKLRRDVLAVWRDIADRHGYPFSIYFNLGRDGQIMEHRPEWNRSAFDGREIDRALCYHSGVAEGYLWPMIREVMGKYQPQGWWLDGSCFTVRLCYCDKCRARFAKETGMKPPAGPTDMGWEQYHEMQRQIYREHVHQTAQLVHEINPDCLVAVNWAYSLRMPEKPDPGLAYLTGDIGNRVEGLSAEAHWYDGTGMPFDLMTQLNTMHSTGENKKPSFGPKPPVQLQQEMAIIVANGGRFWIWDNPTPESGLVPDRHEFLAEHVAPWLRARQTWCLGTRRLADVSLLNSATDHYAITDAAGTACFNRRNNRIEGAAALLPKLHLNYEMIGDWRLWEQDVESSVLIVEHSKRLSQRDVESIVTFTKNGGTVLLTGMAVVHGRARPLAHLCGITDVKGPDGSERLRARTGSRQLAFDHWLFRFERTSAATLITAGDSRGLKRPLLVRNRFGRGTAYYFATPLLTSHGSNAVPIELIRSVLDEVLPEKQRDVTTDAPDTVEIVLREKAGAKIVHLVNMAAGKREIVSAGRRYVKITSLPPVPACRLSVRFANRPARVTLQPQGKPLDDWRYVNSRIEFGVPSFAVHQMIVIEQ